MFVTIRGIDALGVNFKLPTTDHFFNIFHPYDPVAYRIEALVNSELTSLRPVLVPHHKGNFIQNQFQSILITIVMSLNSFRSKTNAY